MEVRKVGEFLKERLLSHVESHDNPESCWIWKDSNTYGTVRINGKKYKSHRLMCQVHHKVDVTGLCVLHSCDNPRCINPNHLRVGTHQENMQDRVLRNRGGNLKGSNNGRALLNEDDVVFIRKSKLQTKELMSMYGISKVTICGIRRGAKWKHV